MMVVLLFCLVFANVRFSSPMPSNTALEGYSLGYLSDCPLGNHEPIIKKKTLKRLSFLLVESNSGNGRKTRYTYYQMKELGVNPAMDYRKKTIVYVGGFLEFPGFIIATSFGSAYKKLDYNVLLLDTNYFTTMEYPLPLPIDCRPVNKIYGSNEPPGDLCRGIEGAALFTRTVGKHVAEMLGNLTSYGLDAKKLELVGLSLGGQTVSYIGKNFYRLTGTKISRITGLDPAGPCFRHLGPEDRLDQTDADFVDAIYTNIDGLGMAAPMGHVNFYVNGGEFQPEDFFWFPCSVFCSHLRAYTLWLSSLLNQDSCTAVRCDSVQEARSKDCYDRVPLITNIVGPKTDRSKQGIFYLSTDNNFPYCLGKKGLKREYEFFGRLLRKIVDSNDMII